MKKDPLATIASPIAPGSVDQKKQSDATASKFSTPGKKHYVTTVDGDIREYYVNIPPGYDGITARPVVFMLHGSGGNGLEFYNRSGWVQEGEKDNIITVYPSSWKYDCVIDDNIEKHNAEKWTDYTLVLCDNNKKRDDIKFLNKVIDEVQQKFSVDAKRIYLVGFSNGGNMAARCAIELSGRLAAIVSCAGALPPDVNMTPVRKLPVMVQIGSSDDKLMANLGVVANQLPLDIPLLLSTYPLIQSVVNSYITSFALNANYTRKDDPLKYSLIDYTGISGDPRNVFRFIEIKGLDHEYANGKNHCLKAAEAHWQWMKNFTLP
jgi:poly(3-hydroxybutyrate) depolymerase